MHRRLLDIDQKFKRGLYGSTTQKRLKTIKRNQHDTVNWIKFAARNTTQNKNRGPPATTDALAQKLARSGIKIATILAQAKSSPAIPLGALHRRTRFARSQAKAASKHLRKTWRVASVNPQLARLATVSVAHSYGTNPKDPRITPNANNTDSLWRRWTPYVPRPNWAKKSYKFGKACHDVKAARWSTPLHTISEVAELGEKRDQKRAPYGRA